MKLLMGLVTASQVCDRQIERIDTCYEQPLPLTSHIVNY